MAYGPGGVVLRGEQHYMAKLAEADVREIRQLWADGVPNAVLKRRFQVTHPTITKIVQRIRWTHVP